MASYDGFPDRTERDRLLAAIREAVRTSEPARAAYAAIGTAQGNRMAYVLAAMKTAVNAQANQMAPLLAAVRSAVNTQADQMALAVAGLKPALDLQAAATGEAVRISEPARAAIAAMGSALMASQIADAVGAQDSPIPALRVTPTEPYHNCVSADAEINRLRRRVRLLESQVRGHWLDDTDEYDLDSDSLPWATEEG